MPPRNERCASSTTAACDEEENCHMRMSPCPEWGYGAEASRWMLREKTVSFADGNNLADGNDLARLLQLWTIQMSAYLDGIPLHST